MDLTFYKNKHDFLIKSFILITFLYTNYLPFTQNEFQGRP